jgi:hypothetical protein
VLLAARQVSSISALARKPGALRNGAPFKDWVLSASLERVRRKLKTAHGDRQMVEILGAVLTDGVAAVEAAFAEALTAASIPPMSAKIRCGREALGPGMEPGGDAARRLPVARRHPSKSKTWGGYRCSGTLISTRRWRLVPARAAAKCFWLSGAWAPPPFGRSAGQELARPAQ